MTGILDKTTCTICKSNHSTLIGKIKSGNTIYQCISCNHMYIKEKYNKSNIKDFYKEDFFNDKYKEENENSEYCYEKDEKNIKKFASLRLDWIEKYIRKGRMLDIGCALGFYMDIAKQRGWDTVGVEISEYAAKKAISRGHNVKIGEIYDFKFKKEEFDFIGMWLVLEHSDNPLKLIKYTVNYLKKDGILGIKVPNADGITFKLNRKKWLEQHTIDHLQDFSINSLKYLLQSNNLNVIHYETEGIYLKRALNALKIKFPKLKSDIIEKEKEYETFYGYLAKELYLGDSLVMYASKMKE